MHRPSGSWSHVRDVDRRRVHAARDRLRVVRSDTLALPFVRSGSSKALPPKTTLRLVRNDEAPPSPPPPVPSSADALEPLAPRVDVDEPPPVEIRIEERAPEPVEATPEDLAFYADLARADKKRKRKELRKRRSRKPSEDLRTWFTSQDPVVQASTTALYAYLDDLRKDGRPYGQVIQHRIRGLRKTGEHEGASASALRKMAREELCRELINIVIESGHWLKSLTRKGYRVVEIQHDHRRYFVTVEVTPNNRPGGDGKDLTREILNVYTPKAFAQFSASRSARKRSHDQEDRLRRSPYRRLAA